MAEPDGTRIHVTQTNENDALEFLKTRPADKPFCLTAAFFVMHAKVASPQRFLPQPESMKVYEDIAVPVAPHATDESFQRLPQPNPGAAQPEIRNPKELRSKRCEENPQLLERKELTPPPAKP